MYVYSKECDSQYLGTCVMGGGGGVWVYRRRKGCLEDMELDTS